MSLFSIIQDSGSIWHVPNLQIRLSTTPRQWMVFIHKPLLSIIQDSGFVWHAPNRSCHIYVYSWTPQMVIPDIPTNQTSDWFEVDSYTGWYF